MPVPQNASGPEPEVPSSSWADQMEDEEASNITADSLPEPKVTIDGDIKTVVSYDVQDEKVRKTTRVYKIERLKVPKAVARRKQWKKFGNAVEDNKDGPDPATTQIVDEVFLALTTNREALEQQDDDPLKKLTQQQKGMVTCRICKGDHWTSKCPYKDTLGENTLKELEDPGPQKSEAAGGPAGLGAGDRLGGGGGKYVPPNQRGKMKDSGDTMMSSRMQQDDQTTVRVTNLSEDAQEADLRDLFNHFGMIRRIFLAKDKITQQSKGFAFISYQHRDDAQKSIDNLNGFGYDHLILKVEWAKPSKRD